MKVLVLGGTRFFGVHLVRELIRRAYEVTVATRGITPDPFGDAVTRVHVDRLDPKAMKAAFQNAAFDVVFDNLAYCSNDIRTALSAIDCGRYIMASTMSVYLPDALGAQTPESAYQAGEKASCMVRPAL